MSRKDLQIEEGGFPIYSAKQLPKIEAMRRAKSLPDVYSPIIPSKGQALFTTEEEMHDEPASCYNCQFYIESAERCALIGPRVPIRKLTYPEEKTADAIPIEYWPCCSMQLRGETKKEEYYLTTCDPDSLDLTYINAPKPGQKLGGANCGGCNGGDDCDSYLVDGAVEKWESPTGFCRALQLTVACGDVCSLWEDDDQLHWRDALKIIQTQDGENGTR